MKFKEKDKLRITVELEVEVWTENELTEEDIKDLVDNGFSEDVALNRKGVECQYGIELYGHIAKFISVRKKKEEV